MAIWDDIAKKASVLGEKAMKQAKDLSETAKLRLQLAEAEKAAIDSYTQLGRLYAATHPEDFEDAFAEAMAATANAEKAVATLRQQLQDARGIAVCVNCGAEVPKDAAYCSACGAEIPQPAPVEAEIVAEETPAEEPAAEEPTVVEPAPEEPVADTSDFAD